MTTLGHFDPFPISSFSLFLGLSQYRMLSKIAILRASVFSVIFHNIEYLSCCSYSHIWISRGDSTTLHYPHLNTDTFSPYSNIIVILLSGIYCLYCKQSTITLRVPLQLLQDIMRLSLWCQHDKTIIQCETKIIQPVASSAFCEKVWKKQESQISKASPCAEILIKNITKSLSHLHISRIKMHHLFVAIQLIMSGSPGII